MNTYAQDIGQWAAAIPQTGFDIATHSVVSRRSSFTSSTASESPALSASSQQSSATSSSSLSFPTSEQGLDFDSYSAACYDQFDSNQAWRPSLTVVPLPGQDCHQTLVTKPCVTDNLHAQWGYFPNRPHPGQSVGTAQNTQACLRRAAASLWNHRSLLRDGKPCPASRQPGAFLTEAERTANSTYHRKSTLQQPVGHHPRRTLTGRCWSKPSLVRQEGRKEDFVMHLVGELLPQPATEVAIYQHFLEESATQLVAHIWPASKAPTSQAAHRHGNPIITLSFFIQETLRRSRSTYSTLQVTLYYLYLIKTKRHLSTSDSSEESSSRALHCGRRMFLAALILASKYLQDRNYSTKAWSKITSLPVHEINANERVFLAAIDYSLYLPLDIYNYWCTRVQECVEAAKFDGHCPWSDVFVDMSSSKTRPATSIDSASSPLQPLDSVSATPFGLCMSSTKDSMYEETTALRCETSNNPLPPSSPTLSRTLTTPSISPWTANSSTPAASTSDSKRQSGNNLHCSNINTSSTTRELPTHAWTSRSAAAGSHMAPGLAEKASLATTKSAHDTEMLYLKQAGSVASPTSGVSCRVSTHRSASPLCRIAAISKSSSSSTTTTSCHLPSPLRLGITQLPTPPISASSLSSVTTAPLDSPVSSVGNPDTISDDGSSVVVTNLLHRVALEAQKHGLGPLSSSSDFTLPPIKPATAYDSFSDISSEASSDLRWPLTLDDSAPCARGTLPALAHVLQCGLKEHLKPYMRCLRQQSASPLSNNFQGVKRGCTDDEDDQVLGRMAKIQRSTTWH